MKKVNFDSFRQLAPPESWIDNALKIPEQPQKPIPLSRFRKAATAASFVLILSLSFVIYFFFGDKNSVIVAARPTEAGSRSFFASEATNGPETRNPLSETLSAGESSSPSVAETRQVATEIVTELSTDAQGEIVVTEIITVLVPVTDPIEQKPQQGVSAGSTVPVGERPTDPSENGLPSAPTPSRDAPLPTEKGQPAEPTRHEPTQAPVTTAARTDPTEAPSAPTEKPVSPTDEWGEIPAVETEAPSSDSSDAWGEALPVAAAVADASESHENFTLRFASRGGSGSMSWLQCQTGVLEELPPNGFSKPGHRLAGWIACRLSDMRLACNDGLWHTEAEARALGVDVYLIPDLSFVAFLHCGGDTVTMIAEWER